MRLGWMALAILAFGTERILAQTIQLPSFSSFSVTTSVIVPDSGPAPAARDRQPFYTGGSFLDLAPRRTTGAARRVSGMDVKAQIHAAEHDDATALARAAARSKTARPADKNVNLTPALGQAPKAGVTALERLRQQRTADAAREAQQLVEKGRQAQAAGKPAVAITYFRSASRLASGELKQQIETEIGKVAKAKR